MNDEANASSQAAALAEELARHHAGCWGWALSCCRFDHPEAEDVLHTAYLKVLDGRARFAERSSFSTWLLGVIRTTAAEQRRKRWRQQLALLRKADPDPAPPRAGSDADAERLRRELTTLPDRQREVLHLVFYADLSISEAARVMEVSVGTARTHYERGKAKLRQNLRLEERA